MEVLSEAYSVQDTTPAVVFTAALHDSGGEKKHTH